MIKITIFSFSVGDIHNNSVASSRLVTSTPGGGNAGGGSGADKSSSSAFASTKTATTPGGGAQQHQQVIQQQQQSQLHQQVQQQQQQVQQQMQALQQQQVQLQQAAQQQQQQQQQMMYFGSQQFSDSNAAGLVHRKASVDQLLDTYGTSGGPGGADLSATVGEHGLTRAQLLEIQKQRSQSTPNTPKVSTTGSYPPDAPLMNAQGGLMDPYTLSLIHI